MGVYLRGNMGCMTDFGHVILDTNLPTFMTIQACSLMVAEEVDAIVFRFACGILLALELEVVGADA